MNLLQPNNGADQQRPAARPAHVGTGTFLQISFRARWWTNKSLVGHVVVRRHLPGPPEIDTNPLLFVPVSVFVAYNGEIAPHWITPWTWGILTHSTTALLAATRYSNITITPSSFPFHPQFESKDFFFPLFLSLVVLVMSWCWRCVDGPTTTRKKKLAKRTEDHYPFKLRSFKFNIVGHLLVHVKDINYNTASVAPRFHVALEFFWWGWRLRKRKREGPQERLCSVYPFCWTALRNIGVV